MAIIHRAQIRPTKLELISAWLPVQSWFGDTRHDALVALGAYRFDDPAGEVGMETLLVGAGEIVVQVPMTYRAAPLPGGTEALMGTMEHSVLGTRWVYDATADPVYANALATTVLQGRPQAEELVETVDGPTPRTPTATVRGTGSSVAEPPPVSGVGELVVSTVGSDTTIASSAWTLVVLRILDRGRPAAVGAPVLLGSWIGQTEPVLLATARAARAA